jgi:hypothetical protein
MRGPGPTTALVGVIVTVVALALIFGLGAIFGLGPFNEEGELSRGQLIVRADAICAEANDAFAEQQAKQPQTPDQAAELTGHLVGIAEDEADRIAQLDGSPELDAELGAYLKARERGVELLKQGRTAAEDEDADGYEAAQAELERTQPERWHLAREIGFSECSRPQPSLR